MSIGIRRTHDEIEKTVNNLGYELLDEYMNGKHKKVVIRDRQGYKYDAQFDSLVKGRVPYFVAKGNPFVLENIHLWLLQEEKPFELCEGNEYRGNEEKLWFHCLVEECYENFSAGWGRMHYDGQGCPYCSGHKVSDRNRLSVVRSDIANEWDYKLNEDTPQDVSYASVKKRFWICPKGHESYPSTIANRTNRSSGCPQCANEQTESKIATELKLWCSYTFGNECVDIEHKMFRNPNTDYWLRCDIYIGKNKTIDGIYIEIHGKQHFIFSPYWHKTMEKFNYNKKLDKIKKKFAKANGTYIEIDLRKITTTEQAIEYIETIINKAR